MPKLGCHICVVLFEPLFIGIGNAHIVRIFFNVIRVSIGLLIYQRQNAVTHIFRRAGLPQVLEKAADAFRIGVRHFLFCLCINLLQLLQLRLLMFPCKLSLDTVFQNRVPGGEVIGLLLEPLNVIEADADLHKIFLYTLPVNVCFKSFFGKLATEFFQIRF